MAVKFILARCSSPSPSDPHITRALVLVTSRFCSVIKGASVFLITDCTGTIIVLVFTMLRALVLVDRVFCYLSSHTA